MARILSFVMCQEVKHKESYLFLLPWSLESVGGVNQVVENLFRQMKLDGKYDPMIMVNSWDDVKIRTKKINGTDHSFFRLRSPWNSSRKLFNFLAFCVETIGRTWKFSKFIKSNKIVVINVHYCSLFALSISLMKWVKIFKGKLVLSFHGADLMAAKESHGVKKMLWKILVSSADKIITCSESLRGELVKFEEACAGKTITVHNGVDTSKFCSYEGFQTDSQLVNKRFILNVATLEHKKGQDVLLRAFKIVVEKFEDVFLVIVGRPGGAEGQIRRLIKSFGLSQRVRLYEGLPHEEVSTLMKKATIFVLPSRYEPFGIVTLEAGAFGVPVIASNVGGIREVLTHDKTGRLCEPDDVDALALELCHLLNNPEERNRLGENLRKHVIENFSWNRSYQKYLDCIGL